MRPQRQEWCSDWCHYMWRVNHVWKAARDYAKKRDDGKCVKCGSTEDIEVNHIRPLRGMGYRPSCWHHLDNLETLCAECHDSITFIQNRTWA